MVRSGITQAPYMAYLELIEGKSGMDVCQFMESEFFCCCTRYHHTKPNYHKNTVPQKTKIQHKSPHSVKSTKDNESQITES